MLGNFGDRLAWRKAQTLIISIAVIVFLLFLYGWHLGTLTPGLSQSEANARQTSQSLNLIAKNPINAPHRIGQLLFQHLDHHGAFWMRSISVAFALFFILCFFILARYWFGHFIAVLSTLIFATSPWIVILGRSATADILLLSPLAVIATYVWLNKTKKNQNLALLLLATFAAMSLYVPGLFWFLLFSSVLAYRSLFLAAKNANKIAFFAATILFLTLLTPLVAAIVKEPSTAKALLLIPILWPSAISIAKSLGWALLSLVVRTREHLDYILGRLPILDVIQITLALFGAYAMRRKARHILYLVVMVIALGVLAVGINGNLIFLTLTLPAIAILIAAGMRRLYLKWGVVFPQNPLPRGLAVVLMGLLVAFHISYGVRYALVAWPHNSDTRKVYVLK